MDTSIETILVFSSIFLNLRLALRNLSKELTIIISKVLNATKNIRINK